MAWWVELSEIVRNFGLLAAAVVGVVLAGMRVVAAKRQADAALRQAELARRDHVAELLNRAVGQLDDARLQVRLGAIYTLAQITQDFPDLSGAVRRVLSESIFGMGLRTTVMQRRLPMFRRLHAC